MALKYNPYLSMLDDFEQKRAGGVTVSQTDTNPFMSALDEFEQRITTPISRPTVTVNKPKSLEPTNPILRGLNITSQGIQGPVTKAIDFLADALPDNVGKYLQDPTKVTPQTTTERVLQGGSELAGSLLPISGLYAGVSKIPALAKLGTYGQAAAKGALSGGIYEGGRSALEGQPLPDVAKNAAIGAVGWGAGDVALKGAGALIRGAAQANQLNRVGGLDLRNPVKAFKAETPAPRATRSGGTVETVPARDFSYIQSGPQDNVNTLLKNMGQYPNKTPKPWEVLSQATTPTTQQTAEQQFYDLIGNIQRPVQESMVPPLESQRQLVNYIHEGLDGEISKNEIAKMDYNNLSDLAQEIAKGRKQMPLWDLAGQQAEKQGVNLDDLYQTATNPEYARMREVVGLSPARPLNAAVANARLNEGQAVSGMLDRFATPRVPNTPQPPRTSRSGFLEAETFTPAQVQAQQEVAAAQAAGAAGVPGVGPGATLKRKPMIAGEGIQAMASPGATPPTGGTVTGTVKRRDIIKFLDDTLNVPIRTGRFKQKALGIFKIKPEVVRTKIANDLPVISHEVGHYLDKHLGLTNHAFDRELMALGSRTSLPSYTPDQIRKEGVAEFMRLFLTDEQAARQAAPNYFTEFENKISSAPDIKDALSKAQQDIYTWYNQPAKARVLGSMSISEKEQNKTTLGRLYSLFIDEIDPLKSVSKMAGPLPAEKDPYKLAWVGRGWTGKAETLLNKGVLDANGNKIGNSLKEILKPVEKNLDDFRAYAVAKHAQEINSYGMKSGLTDADIAEVLQNSPAEYQQVLDGLVKYQDNLLEMLADAGVISRDSIAVMRQKYPNYVPFYRSFTDDPNAAIGFLGKGYANLRSPVKKMTGSDRDILDPLESIVKNTYLFSNIAAKNKVGRAVAELANTTEGIGRLAEKVEGSRSGKENVLDVWNNGELEHYQVQPDLYRAITSLDQESANMVIKLMSYPAQALRAGAVLSPDFMVRNPMRDQFSAFINSKYGFRPIIDLGFGLFHAIKRDDLYWQWLNSGGGMSTMVSLDRDYLQGGLRKIISKSRKDKVKSVFRFNTLIEPLRYVSELMEQGTRLGEFRKGIKAGASPFEAALSSRDVTLDFARAGSKMKNWNRISAFLNASVQGADKMVRQFKSNPVGSTVKSVVGITLPSLILHELNKDDPRYQELPQWEKDLFWIIPTEDHLYRIPKPFELGVLFGSLPERILGYIDSKDPEAFKGLGETFKTFRPNIVPTFITTAYENKANYSLFRDRPIVPQREQKLPAELQYGPQTTEAAKAIGKVLNVSPRKVENAVQGYTGGLGMYVMKAGNLLPNNSPKKPALSTEEYPVLKSFMQKPYVSSQSMQDFYDELDKVEKQYAKQKETGGRQEGFNMGRLRELRRVSQQLSDMRKLERNIQDSKTLSPQQKKQQLDKLNMYETNKVRAALKRPAIK